MTEDRWAVVETVSGELPDEVATALQRAAMRAGGSRVPLVMVSDDVVVLRLTDVIDWYGAPLPAHNGAAADGWGQ